jgi:hypothetical protein
MLPGDDPKTVVFDLVQPFAAGGQPIGFGWKARRDEPRRERTLQHAALIKLGNGGSQIIRVAIGMAISSATKRQALR